MNLECGSATRFAADRDRAADLPDNPIDGRKTESSTLAFRLGSEKRIEDAMLDLFRDPHSGITDPQQHILPERNPGKSRRVGFVRFHIRRPDAQRSAARHGVPGVHRQIHQHLVHLVRVRHNGPARGIGLCDQFDIFPNQALQHGVVLSDQLMRIHRSGLDHLFAAECQQLTGEIHRTLARPANLLHPLPRRVLLLVLTKQQIAVTVDYRQQVVEIVGHPTGQPADAFQLLRLLKLLLQLQALRLGAP